MSRTSEPNKTPKQELNFLQLKRMHIDTHQEPVIYMHKNCHVCRAEGFYAQSRVRITTEKNRLEKPSLCPEAL